MASIKNKFLRFVLIFIAFFTLKSANANHELGGEITYNYIGNKKYVIFMTVYRDCRDVAFNPAQFGYRHYYGPISYSYKNTYNRKFKVYKIEDITNLCPGQNSPCTPLNKSYNGFGIERHIYVDTFDMSDTIVAYNMKKGNYYLTFSIEMYYSGRFYISELYLKNLTHPKLAYNNSGSYFSTPSPKVVMNEGTYLSFGIIDPEKDSIKYDFVFGRTSLNNSIAYSSPQSYRYPTSVYCVPATTIKCTPSPGSYPPKGMYLDTNTGDVVYTPTTSGNLDYIAVQASQYRKDSLGKWTYLGYTIRDIGLWQLTSGYNFPPLMKEKSFYKICGGRKLEFDFSLKDSQWAGYQSAPDTVQVKFFDIPQGAQITETTGKVNHKKYHFSWQTKFSDSNFTSYKLRIEATDRFCSPPARVYRTIGIKVDGRCCDSFKIPRVVPPKVYTLKVGDSLLIKSDTAKNVKNAIYKWLGKSPQFDYANIIEGKPYSGVKSTSLKISPIQFSHDKMKYRFAGNTDICKDSGSLYEIKIADTCFFVHIDTIIHNIYDTIRTKLVFHDTIRTHITIRDTIKTYIKDTLYVTHNDTIKHHIYYYDTIRTQLVFHDTIRHLYNDTQFIKVYVSVQDTLKFVLTDTNKNGKVNGDFKIYPVPSNKTVYLKLTDFKYFVGYYVDIFDITGKLVEHREIISDLTEFHLSKWGSRGNYMFRLMSPDNKVVTVKVIIYM